MLFVAACSLAPRLSAVTVGVDEGCAGMGEVAWSEQVAGDGTTRLTLKAAAAEGCAFSEWEVSDAGEVAWPADVRYPGSLVVTVSTSAVVTASFVPSADDYLEFDLTDLLPEYLAYGEEITLPVDVDSASFPHVSFTGLPPGISYDATTLTLSGKAKSPGVYEIEAEGKNESGFTFRDFFVLTVGNIVGAHVYGEDVEIPLGEYYQAEFAESEFGSSSIFCCDGGWSKVSLSGYPRGLTWDGDSEMEILSGTPTDVGDYTIKAEVTFTNGIRIAHETATLVMSVVAPDPGDYDVDLGCLEGLYVGDELFEQEIGQYDARSMSGILAVSGLPTGISATKSLSDGAWHWVLDGKVTQPGRYEVAVRVATTDGDGKQKKVNARHTVLVRDIADVYLPVSSADASMGSVSGGGAVSPVEDARITASAKSGYVFSGWYDADGEAMRFENGTDYRSPTVTFEAGSDFSFLSPVAHFIAREDDDAPEFLGLDGSEYSFAADETLSETFEIESASLPTVTCKGLPTGVTCEPDGNNAFVLAYDGSAVASQPSPGRYTVTATAANRAGRKSTASFIIIVANIANPRIRVEDDYGEYDPGYAIDAIDLSDAVDFGKGETLAVTGLPKGLTYNAKAKKDVAANTITGTPTAPGYYTLTFTAKVVASATTNANGKIAYKYETAKATSFLTVLPYPELFVEADDGALEAGNKVSGGGNYKAGTKVTLKATAAKGWVFAGWDGLDDVGLLEALNPKLTYVTTEDDVFVHANFIEVRDDWLVISELASSEAGYALELPLNEPIDETSAALLFAEMIDTGSYPTVKVTDLPKGIKFSASTFTLSGKPTKSGVYHVTVSAKNAGGYSFVRVLDIAVLEADGSLPEADALPNDAGIDFAPLANLVTGTYCPTGAVVLAVGANPQTGASAKKVSLSGLPFGLASAVVLAGEEATVEITGTPTKPGRQILTLKVTYASGKSATSKCAIVVEDGGSQYLDVVSLSEDGGVVSGTGVYAAGAKVKVTAKPKSKYVFAGWQTAAGRFKDVDAVDYRTPSPAFVFRPDAFDGEFVLYGDFAAVSDDNDIAISFDGEVWGIDPDAASEWGFVVDSKSLPTVTAKGLPKGVTMDVAREAFFYTPTAAATPGIYAVSVSAKNATVKKTVTASFEIRIANRTSDVIHGLDPDMDAYPVFVGTTLDPGQIVPTAEDGWALSVQGLPSGLSYKKGIISGVPTKAGDYTVTFTATTGNGTSKRTEVATITIRVSALPVTATGTLNGFVKDGEDVVGTVTLSATAAGKVSASVVMPAKKYSFSAKSWDSFTDGKGEAKISSKDDFISVAVDSTMEWTNWQLSGTCQIGNGIYDVVGQRNPYGKQGGDDEARGLISAMVGKSTYDGWMTVISNNGTVRITGKYKGKTISGSCMLMYDDGFFSEYVTSIDKKSTLCIVMAFDDAGKITMCEVSEN